MARFQGDDLMFNVQQFSANINKYGTLQTNRFEVNFRFPYLEKIEASTPNVDNFSRNVGFRASSVKVPGLTLDVQNVTRYGVGPQQKFPTNVNVSDIDITFIDTADNELWKNFMNWMNKIFDYNGQTQNAMQNRGSTGKRGHYTVDYQSAYATDVIIKVFNTGSIEPINRITLVEAFPVSLSDVDLSWSDNSKLYEFTTRFTYSRWYHDSANQSISANAVERLRVLANRQGI